MTAGARAWLALGSLGLILTITASWWALALWPVDGSGPAWVLRTREVCFGAAGDGLPNAGGWILLIGQPLGMLSLLAVIWPRELRASLALALSRVYGQLALGAVAAAIVVGLGAVAGRVTGAGGDVFSPGTTRDLAAQLTRVDDAPPVMALVDQAGRTVTLDAFRGRAVLVTFAFAHCETICPMVVADVQAAAKRLADDPPAVLVVTLDPWRDTPGRLPAIADAWRLTGDAHVLSGAPAVVERTLNAWRIPRVRNERTGDLSHPSVVYIIGRDGRIAYVVPGGADMIAAAVREL
jgi:cytochrome oxidase Cu insertion factor (SCO1/SenC/PrrC family)